MLDEAPRILHELQSYQGANEEIRQVSFYTYCGAVCFGVSFFPSIFPWADRTNESFNLHVTSVEIPKKTLGASNFGLGYLRQSFQPSYSTF